MGHLNELHQKYAEKGLVVLSVTNETRSKVDEYGETKAGKAAAKMMRSLESK